MVSKANYVVIPRSERKIASGAKYVCPCNPDERIEVSVHLRRKTAAQGSPTVPPCHLTHRGLEDRYGAELTELAKVADFAKMHDLVVLESSAAKRVVKLSGTISDFSQAFDVNLGHFEHPQFTYRGRTGSIGIPRELDGIIIAVLGLDNRPFAKPHFSWHQPEAAGAAAVPAAAPFHGFPPATIADLYGFPPGDGAGQTVGIIELGGGFRPADLNAYFAGLGINPTPSVLPVPSNGNRPGTLQQPSSANGEVMLDIEVIGAIVPRAKIVVYFGQDASDDGFVTAMHNAVHDSVNNPSVISISWGGSEDTATGQFQDAFNLVLEDAQSLTITVLVASGDNGAADMQPVADSFGNPGWDGIAHVDFPSSSPLVLSCGATRIDLSGTTLAGEAAWNQGFADTDPRRNTFGSVGGGISTMTAPPPWQAGIVLPPSVNNGAPPGRGVPDVTGNGDPASGYQIRVDGRTGIIGGTSAVAPLWAGLIIRINQSKGARVGFINDKLYANPRAFNDITVGSNKVTLNGVGINVGYDATPGWDACTGLGSPEGTVVQRILS